MIRGLYTAASGMIAQMHRLDAVANNLANVDLTGYKRDTAIFKSFPELLLRRMNDDGVYVFPVGSVDTTPIVGNLGTGVELNEVFTDFSTGSLKATSNAFDLALDGEGFFCINTTDGERYTRNGSFLLNPEGYLVTKSGDFVLGEDGPIKLDDNRFTIDNDGVIYKWENMERIDRLKLVKIQHPLNLRYLRKKGNSYWQSTPESGEPIIIPQTERPKVKQGFLETANVNPVTEMVQMIEVNRSYEANQRMIQSQDQLLGRLINDAAKV